MDPIGASDTWRWHGYKNSWVVIDGVKMQSVSGGGHRGGGMFISTRDQARFGYLFLRNGKWKDKQLISEKWIKMLTPLVPHLSEELWNINNKNLISLQRWPEHNEKLIDVKAEFSEDIVDNVMKDIVNLLKLTKIKPKEITLFISPKWKFAFIKKLKKEMESTRNVGELIKKLLDKPHGKEISKAVPMFVKNPSKLPQEVLSQKEEKDSLENNKKLLEKEFNCKIEILEAEKSKEQKAQQALPSKPAILIK